MTTNIEEQLKDNEIASYYAREYATLLLKHQALEKQLQDREVEVGRLAMALFNATTQLKEKAAESKETE